MTTTRTPKPAFPMNPNLETETKRQATLRVSGTQRPGNSARTIAAHTNRAPILGYQFCVVAWCLLLLGAWSIPARAELPEPDNIIYGTLLRDGWPVTATDTDVVIEARRNSDGLIVASYRMGDSARAGDHFTLRVPMEVFSPVLDPLASLTDTPLTVVVSDLNGVLAEVPFIMGERGQFHRLNIRHFGGFDTDGDELLDEWERFWFGNLFPGPNSDTDGDGATDGLEYVAGTNPTDFNSRFRLVITRTGVTGKEVSFVAQATSGAGYQGKVRKYTLEATSDLGNPAWQPVQGYVGVIGAGQTVRYPVPNPGSQMRFYRVAIQLTDVGPPLPQ